MAQVIQQVFDCLSYPGSYTVYFSSTQKQAWTGMELRGNRHPVEYSFLGRICSRTVYTVPVLILTNKLTLFLATSRNKFVHIMVMCLTSGWESLLQ